MTRRLEMDDEYFESMYRHDDDPWGFDSRFYERRKYDMTLASLGKERYRSVFEPGCANAALTVRLARRCDQLVGCDIVTDVVERARHRTARLDHVRIEQQRFPDYWPEQALDLVVWSEIAYYVTADQLDLALVELEPHLDDDGELVVVNYTGATDYPRSAEDVDAQIARTPWLRRHTEVHSELFHLCVWRRTGTVDADSEGSHGAQQQTAPETTSPGPRPRADVSSIDRVVVIVPAHNEEEHIELAMSAIGLSTGTCVPVTVVVVADSCSDHTEQIVRARMQRVDWIDWHCVSTSASRASSARQAGLDHVTNDLLADVRSNRIAVLSTDADTVVPPDWISHHVRRLNNGADAVAGIIELAPSARIDLAYDDWWSEYTSSFRPDGTHAHVHCANLSVRLDLLIAAGGFGHLDRAEDIDVWRRLHRLTAARMRSDQSTVVRTSHRADGRVTGGFATAIDRYRHPSP